MTAPHARAEARFPCDIVVDVLGPGRRRPLGRGRLVDASPSGGRLLINGALRRGVSYRMRFAPETGVPILAFQVAHEGARVSGHPETRSYGLSFAVTDEEKDSWRRRLDVLRRRATTIEEDRLDRSLRGYWSA